jgi:glycogen(starch) synthase
MSSSENSIQSPARAKPGSNRVLLVGSRPPPSGGMASHVADLESALRRRGDPVEVLDFRARPRGGDGYAYSLGRLALARLRGEVIHLHTNGHNRRSWELALLCSGPRSLLTVHSGLAPGYCRREPRLVRSICARYQLIVAVNQAIAEALGELGFPPTHLEVRPAFSFDSIRFRLPPPGFRSIRQTHPTLFACALGEGKEYGAHLLLEAVAQTRKRLPKAVTVVFGPGTTAPKFLADLSRRQLARVVLPLGELTRSQALYVMAESDVFIRPTLADGDSVSVREALALGRPVVASAVGTRPAGVLPYPADEPSRLAEQLFQAVGKHPTVTTFTSDDFSWLLRRYRQLAGTPPSTGTALAVSQS